MALSDVKFEKKLTSNFKYDMRNWIYFNASSGKSENLHFDLLFLSKVFDVWAKESTEELCLITVNNDAKFERNWLVLWKITWGNRRNLTQQSKKSALSLAVFDGSIYCLNEKITEELCVMTLKGDAIFKEKLTGGSKNYLGNLVNFHASSRKSENLHFDGFFCPKYIKF